MKKVAGLPALEADFQLGDHHSQLAGLIILAVAPQPGIQHAISSSKSIPESRIRLAFDLYFTVWSASLMNC